MAARRREMRLVVVAAAVMLCAADPKKESTRMVDEAAVALAQSSRQGAAESASRAAAACRAVATEPQCALQNGCAWCSQKSAQPPAGTRRAASGATRDEHTAVFVGGRRSLLEEGKASAKDSRACMAWQECTGPASLCELRASESACSGSSATESSCVWCKSEGEMTIPPKTLSTFGELALTSRRDPRAGRCVNLTAKGQEASLNAQCKGCDGKFDSGVLLDACGECGGSSNTTCATSHSFAFTRQEKIGIVLALSGNVLISVSLNTQKYAHNKNEERGAGKLSYLKLKLWWIGMILMAIGETGNFLAYAYAPATIVAPLGAVSVISNCFLAHFVLREHIGVRNLLGVFLAIFGSVIIVLYAPSSDQQLTMDLLVQYMSETSFLALVSLIVVAVLVLFSLRDTVKKRYVVVYTLICSLTGALTVMCIKGVSTALVLTLQGQNQFYNVLPWVLVATVVVTLMIQVFRCRV